jgi:hypothetical protein
MFGNCRDVETCAESFPLDRARGLGRDVVHHPVDGAHSVADLGRHMAEEGGLERVPVCSHAIT